MGGLFLPEPERILYANGRTAGRFRGLLQP
ncbi:hypothetical protein OJF2_27240 [Aquisphaera giovannonii]|uniref:Uncharacterized protein n=1 Tax=Aquisphaera giovannonii TaxID=406548 RepID=A0A5B9W1P2_9BACT|nr:hypothetical protein OJF2_27240 [Aquisphaera giovannonii]